MPRGLPTRVDNALNEQSTRIDLETLFLEKNFQKVVEDKVPCRAHVDNAPSMRKPRVDRISKKWGPHKASYLHTLHEKISKNEQGWVELLTWQAKRLNERSNLPEQAPKKSGSNFAPEQIHQG